MFFLLRAVFWLSVVVLLLPPEKTEAPKAVIGGAASSLETIATTQASVRDVANFCGRQPALCDAGRVAVESFLPRVLDAARQAPTEGTAAAPQERSARVPLPQARPLS